MREITETLDAARAMNRELMNELNRNADDGGIGARGPADDLRLQFEATRALDDDEKEALKALLEGFLLRHDARRWTNAS